MLGAVAGTAPDRVVVKQNFVRGGAVFGAEVDFIAGWPGSPRRVQAFRVPYLLNDMFFQLDGNLVTEWVGGDRPVVEVFHVGQGGVRLVFKHGSRAGPEYWDSSILINNAAIESDGNYHNTTTEIWKWEGRPVLPQLKMECPAVKIATTEGTHERTGTEAQATHG